MAIKIKPDLVQLLRKAGSTKSVKIELFRATKFDPQNELLDANKFRIRVNGKWHGRKFGYKGNYNFVTLEEFNDLLLREVKKILA